MSKINKVINQKLTVSVRTLKHIAKGMESERLKRPIYYLSIQSTHSPHGREQLSAFVHIKIPKGTAEALIQDHGAARDDAAFSYLQGNEQP